MYYQKIDNHTYYIKEGARIVALARSHGTDCWLVDFYDDGSVAQGPTLEDVLDLVSRYYDGIPVVPYEDRDKPLPTVPVTIAHDDGTLELHWVPEYKLPRLRRVRAQVDGRWVSAYEWVEPRFTVEEDAI